MYLSGKGGILKDSIGFGMLIGTIGVPRLKKLPEVKEMTAFGRREPVSQVSEKC